MSALTDFLYARIAEDEVRARDALEGDGRWESYEMPSTESGWGWTGVGLAHEMGHRAEVMLRADAEHMVAWDPARVLIECSAKRRVVDCCRAVLEDRLVKGYNGEALASITLRHMARPFASHPDFDVKWNYA